MKRWLERLGPVALTGLVIWWVGYFVESCRSTAACEASGKIETYNCEPSVRYPFHGRVVCDWKCVEPPAARPPVDTLNEQMHELEESARAFHQQLEADERRRWDRIRWPLGRPGIALHSHDQRLDVSDQDFDAEHWSDF